MANADILFPSTLGKPETQTLWGLCNLEFFCMIDINKMVAIFQFFHNGCCWYSVCIDTWKTGHIQTLGGLVIWNFSVWSILMKWWSFFNFFIVTNANIPFPLTHGKPENQTFGVGHLEFFCTIDINEMIAIFQFFHNGQCWYSISINTWKTGDPSFGGGGLVIWNFSVWLILMKWWLFFNFFIVANANIPFPLTLRKWRPKLWGGSVIWNFSVWLILMKWWLFFNFFIVANANIPFPLTLTNFWGWSFGIFLYDQRPKLWGISNLEFFCTIDINKMAAILKFFLWWPMLIIHFH